VEAVSSAQAELDAAHEAAEESAHADLAATLLAGLEKGDPCPVCGEPMSSMPRRPAAAQLARARKRAADAERQRDAARAAAHHAEADHRDGVRDLERGRKEVERLDRELAEDSARIDTVAAELATS